VRIDPGSGIGRFISNLDKVYKPWPKQAAFHASTAQYRFLGGAAGPGKTLAGIMDHLIACNEFSDPAEAKQVHTLMLRRTFPRLQQGIMTRFKEKVPRELYKSFNESSHTVTWHNGATTVFGSMQHEKDAENFQAQWYKIFFDELCEFTFRQWVGISAWNRCPVSPYSTQDGAGNPIGVGAKWVNNVFVKGKPADEMDDFQKMHYDPSKYAYFPCTYLDNPIYANSPEFLANLNKYRKKTSEALKMGIWGAAGGYFEKVWDEAENVYEDHTFTLKPWYPKWLGGNAGYEHLAAVYWFCIDDFGIVRIYREHAIKHKDPEALANDIAILSRNDEGHFQGFFFSHDAFSSMATRTYGGDPNSIAVRMAPILIDAGLPAASPSTRDKWGRERLLHDMLGQRIQVNGVDRAKLQIARSCEQLVEDIPQQESDPDNPEVILESLNDKTIQGSSYGLFGRFGSEAHKPFQEHLREAVSKAIGDPENPNYGAGFMTQIKMEHNHRKQVAAQSCRSATMGRRQRRYID